MIEIDNNNYNEVDSLIKSKELIQLIKQFSSPNNILARILNFIESN